MAVFFIRFTRDVDLLVILRSPEHEVRIVNYCGRPSSRLAFSQCAHFKKIHLRNYLTDFQIVLLK